MKGEEVAMPLWTPSAERVASTRLHRFRTEVAVDHPEVVDTARLNEFSVREPAEFWQRVWDFTGVVGDPGDVVFEPGDGSVVQ